MLSQNISERSGLINEVNKVIFMIKEMQENSAYDRSFNLHPDSILITYNEVGGHSQKADYAITYVDNKIVQINLRPDLSLSVTYKIYFYYDINGSLYRAIWYEVVAGVEVVDFTVHYNYDQADELIAYIEYDKNNKIVYGDSLEYSFNGSNFESFRFLSYQGEQYGWEPSDYIFNMKYINNELTAFEKSEYFRFEEDIIEIRNKYENVTFYENEESTLFKSIFEYGVFDSATITKNILSVSNAATTALPSPMAYDKYYFDYDSASYVPQQKSVATQINNVLTLKLYNNIDTVDLLNTDIFTFNGMGQLTNNTTLFNNSEQVYIYEYNDHGHLSSFTEALNGNPNSSGQYEYIVDNDGNLIEYILNGQSSIFGSYRDRYQFIYNEIMITSRINPESILTIHPNPVKQCFSIDMPGIKTNQELSYIIMDLQGRVVLKNKISDPFNTIDVSRLSSGFYLVNVSSGEKMYSSGMIKL